MTKKIFSFRCLSDPSTGFGNFKRALSITELLKEKSYNITFFIDKNNSVIDELKKRNMSYFLIKSKISFLNKGSAPAKLTAITPIFFKSFNNFKPSSVVNSSGCLLCFHLSQCLHLELQTSVISQ